MEIVVMPIGELLPASYNPRKDLQPGDLEYRNLRRSIEEFSLVEPLVWNRRTGNLVGGHQRLKVLKEMGHKDVSVSVVDLSPEREKALNVALNKIQGDWDTSMLVELLEELEEKGQLQNTGFSRGDIDKLLAELEEVSLRKDREVKRKGNREYEIDLIYTLESDGTCCIATRAGFYYGMRSGGHCCPAAHRISMVENAVHDEAWERHAIHFLDNDYKQYDHKKHLDVVAQFMPKYATVMDIMTKEQCSDLGIEFHPLEQILKWAEEVERYAENVILIPKYDCIDEIPERYVLGYSIPTSYGGTPLSIEKFKGRRIHLLGGAPMLQYQYFQKAYEDVVSLDTNYIHLISTYGNIWSVEGPGLQVRDLPLGEIVNPLYVAFAINIGKLGALYRRGDKGGNVDETGGGE